MSINDIGKVGEGMARLILKRWMKVDGIFQADWMVKKNGVYYVVEVKHKEMFKSPPFDGHGLEIRQVNARMMFMEETGIRCLFLVIDMSGRVYWQWLDKLEAGKHFDTKNGIRVYPIENFRRMHKRVRELENYHGQTQRIQNRPQLRKPSKGNVYWRGRV